MNVFYRDQAAREQSAADNAVLENVRDRCQRAANAWAVLAERLEHTDKLRAGRKTDELVKESLGLIGDTHG